uniref:Uncharacterized protein n=1 Tax=Populus alba TaxID=43335 RepID=A0A4U5MAY9_POPAL|nr:hypothetical protein D5086_0000313740 [Populus alba]
MPSEDDILIKKLLLTHDPDGRRLDSELLLRAMENVLCYAAASQVCGFHIDAIVKDDVSDIEVVGSQETLAQIIDRIKFEEVHPDNQDVLGILLAAKDELPLKNSSTQDKLGVSEMKGKVVLLLVSKAELLPQEGLLLLLDRTYDHPYHKKLEGCYEIVWISISDTWTDAERDIFDVLSNSLPWYSVRRPRSKLQLGQSIHSDDHILREVSALLDTANEGWAIIGRGNTADIVKLSASEAIKWLDRFPEWEENVAKLGFVSALRAAIDPPPPPPPPPGP